MVLTKNMQHSCSSRESILSTTQQISRPLMNATLGYRTHNSPELVPVLRHISPFLHHKCRPPLPINEHFRPLIA